MKRILTVAFILVIFGILFLVWSNNRKPACYGVKLECPLGTVLGRTDSGGCDCLPNE